MTHNIKNECVKIFSVNDSEWNAFCSSISSYHYHQSAPWGNFLKTIGWRCIYNIVELNGEEIGGYHIINKNLSGMFSIGIVLQGPIVKNESINNQAYLAKALKETTKKEGLDVLICDIAYRLESMPVYLSENKFKPYSKKLPLTHMVSATAVLPLTESVDSIFKGVSKSRQRDIKLGLKKEVNYKIGNRDDIRVFHKLLMKGAERRGVTSVYVNIDHLYCLWDQFSKESQAFLFIAEYKGEALCAVLGLIISDTYYGYQSGWSGKYSELGITHALYWKSIVWAKENNCAYYDFVQITPDAAQAYLTKQPYTPQMKSDSFFGPTINKMRYGSQILISPGQYLYMPNIVKRILFMNLLRILPYFKKIRFKLMKLNHATAK